MAGLGDYEKKEKGNRGYTMRSNPFQRNYGISPLAVKETEAEFLARMKKEGVPVKPEVEVKMSEHQTQRDILAKQARSSYSGYTKPGMEQSVRSQSYKDADELLAKSKDKDRASDAKKRLRDRKAMIEAKRKELEM